MSYPATTLAAMAEQAALILGGGAKSDDFGYREDDLIRMLRQSCAAVAEKHMSARSLRPGVSPIDGHYVYSYPDIKVTEISELGDVCTATLPEIPLAIVGSRGILAVYSDDKLNTAIKPIGVGSAGMMRSLSPRTPTYEHLGSTLRIRLNGYQITAVSVDMLTVAPSTLKHDDMFPFPLNLQSAAIEMVVAQIRGGLPQDTDNDSRDIR